MLRNLEGKHEISKDDPGQSAGRRQIMPTFEALEEWAGSIPMPYVTLYPEAGAWGARIQRSA